MDMQRNVHPCFDCDSARQGVTGHHVRHVLGWSLVSLVIGFAAVAAIA